ncbi:hypothetical protein B2I21_08730 [Chryseobacterium mucoviscidosis]|nr:hypothetical protein B2I21_08730 [Chryseobacterium mucoviscidosis]
MAEVFKLSRPIQDGDETITEIEYDLEALGFDDLQFIDKQFARIVGAEAAAQTMVKSLDSTYQLLFVSKASRHPFEVMRSISAKDALRLGLRVQNFLFASASEDETEA